MGKEWNLANRDKMRIACAKHRAKNKEKLNADARAIYRANPLKERSAALAWYYANKHRARDNNKKWSTENKIKINAAARSRRHRDLERYRAKERREAGLPAPSRPCPEFCEACARPPNGPHKILALDHCHITGAFRGWLCNRCNTAFGMLGDTLEGIDKLREYATRALGNSG